MEVYVNGVLLNSDEFEIVDSELSLNWDKIKERIPAGEYKDYRGNTQPYNVFVTYSVAQADE